VSEDVRVVALMQAKQGEESAVQRACEAQGSKPDVAGHFGHLSGTLGDAPITLMFVQLDHRVTLNDACWNK
jgi:hypothetical protein